MISDGHLTLPDYWAPIREDVLKQIKPSEKERRKLERFLGRVVDEVKEALSKAGVVASVEIHGSVARDTWLVGVKDIDVFIIMDPSTGKNSLRRVNDVVKGYVGGGWREAYAEHPYVIARMDGFDVEFIPGFRLERGGRVVSAVDRSPLHTGFVLTNLGAGQRDDVRLLKCLMAGIGVYGAEMKVGGFSGYLCELLVIAFGSFEGVVEEAASWSEMRVIQIGESRDEAELRKKFRGPLIVTDPVDPNRNVASAVADTSFWSFVQACRIFVSVPDRRFFFPSRRMVEAGDVLALLEGRGSDVLFILVTDPHPPVPDTLWGQLFRAERGVRKSLEELGFRVMRSGAWSDEASRHVLLMELESAKLTPLARRLGPPVRLAKESADFLSAHLSSPETVGGPSIEGERWWVSVKRGDLDSAEVVKRLMAGGIDSPVPVYLAEKFRVGGEVLLNTEVAPLLKDELTIFLFDWLVGRPVWLG